MLAFSTRATYSYASTCESRPIFKSTLKKSNIDHPVSAPKLKMKRHRIFGMKIANLLLKSDVLAPFQPSKDEKRIILQTEGKKYLRLNLKSRQLCSLKGLRGDTVRKFAQIPLENTHVLDSKGWFRRIP